VGYTIPALYLLFLDESGTHGGSPVFVLGGLAVHESDASHLQHKLESFLHGRLSGPPLSLNAQNFEIHATDIKNGDEEWAVVPFPDRMAVLGGAYSTLLNYGERNPNYPMALFGAVVDRDKVPIRREREKLAYELVLNKFDAMLGRINRAGLPPQSGLVVHDQKVVHGGRRIWTAERAIQEWTRDWREVAGRVGRLRNFADVPLFADSKATRLIQAADVVSYALWRAYGPRPPKPQYLNRVLRRFDAEGGVMHGLIHVSRAFATGSCPCPPCQNRLARGLDPTAL